MTLQNLIIYHMDFSFQSFLLLPQAMLWTSRMRNKIHSYPHCFETILIVLKKSVFFFFCSPLYPLDGVFLFHLWNSSTNLNVNYLWFLHLSQPSESLFLLLGFFSNLLIQYYNTEKNRDNRWHYQSIFHVPGTVLSNFKLSAVSWSGW